jgi:non-lysosomal glucosylceramidase
MTRKCSCSGGCGGQDGQVTRREFVSLAAAGTAGVALGSVAWVDWVQAQMPAEELARWKQALLQPAAPRRYRSGVHTDARMHLGGIGTGDFEIGVDGQLATWQLFNTLRDGQVPFYLAVRAGKTAKLLQTTAGPDWPRVKRIEMTGEYPLATLRFDDPELPIRLELTAFTPMAPLDSRFSSMPVAVFLFRIQNPTAQPQRVSLAGFLQNVIGYDAAGQMAGLEHPNFGGNVNEPLEEAAAKGLLFRAQGGKEPTLDKPVAISTRANLRGLGAPPNDRPKNLTLEILDRQRVAVEKPADPAHRVIWFEDAPADLAETVLRAARDAAQAGATLLFSGRTMPLVQAYAQATGGKPLVQAKPRPDILFEDFERGYEKWTVEGTAFGKRPASGTLPNQQRVSGFVGKGLVNTYLGGDDTTGRLASKPFTIQRRYVRFLIGGGSHPTTQIRLVVGGKTVRAASGHDDERLEPAVWDVHEWEGQTAHLVIVDEQKGPWGHINIDQIVFSDQVGDRAAIALLDEILPGRLSGVRSRADGKRGDPNTHAFENWQPHEGTREMTLRNGLRLFARPLGKGKVVLASGPVLEPAQAELIGARQRAYAVLCELVGAEYTASVGVPPKAPGAGAMALFTLADGASVLPAFESWDDAWKTFAAQGRFEPLAAARPNPPTGAGRTVCGAVAATVEVPAGGTAEVPLVLAWHYPNKYNAAGTWMGCHYTTVWPDVRAVVHEAVEKFRVLRERTERFHRTVYQSTLPYWLLDCLTSQAAIIRHVGVVFRIANGDVYGWEGSNGCCQPTCTHVWGYEQTLSRLFPDLEKEMRRIDFKHQQRPDGGVNNRTDVPSPPHPTGEQPFADGHASCILKAYREALNHPDDSFLKAYWPHVKRAVEYLIGRDAAGSGQPDGILSDDQWNTYDEALHGVTTFISAYYLAALRAGEEWARRMGDSATAERFHAVFLKGQDNLVTRCWNGEFFRQDLPDYLKRSGEVGPGCMSDQLIGQWWAHQLGLGYLLPKDHVQSALRAVFKYNWVPDLTGWKHAPRAFAGAKDKGLLICTWPKSGRPRVVMLYSDEVWTGIEYQVAGHMIYEGMIEEAFAIVKGARDRYDGVPRPPIARNPWNEIECGGHYARAMSSWSLLLALSGWHYDGPAKRLRFAPRWTPENFQSFFTGPEGWGSLRQVREGGTQHSEIAVVEGRLAVARLQVVAPAGAKSVKVALGGKPIEASVQTDSEGTTVTLASPLTVEAGESLVARIQ